jgi:hypothetical protein
VSAPPKVPRQSTTRANAPPAEYIDDPEQCEYFVPMQWLQTVPLNKAVQELGLFGNQNTVCRPTTGKWRTTVERLKVLFPQFDHEEQ